MNTVEYGKCEVCGKEASLKRAYFRYGFKCQCHSTEHFELVRHCADCVPQKPTETKVVLSNEQAENLVPIKRGKWINTYGDTPYDARDKNNWWHCSECKCSVTTMFKSPYCPNCGAKMVEDIVVEG